MTTQIQNIDRKIEALLAKKKFAYDPAEIKILEDKILILQEKRAVKRARILKKRK